MDILYYSTSFTDVLSWLLMNSDLAPEYNPPTLSRVPPSVFSPTPDFFKPSIGGDGPASEGINGFYQSDYDEDSLSQCKDFPLGDGGDGFGIESDSGLSGGGGLKSQSNLPPETKRMKKLERNREIARNCRARKREKIATLEDEVKALKSQNEELQWKLERAGGFNAALLPSSGTSAPGIPPAATSEAASSSFPPPPPPGEMHKEDKRKQFLTTIKGLLEQNHSQELLEKTLIDYFEIFSDFGKDRKMQVKFYLDQLKLLLLPTQVTKMSLYTLHQDDDFYNEKKNNAVNGGGIWNMLCEAMQLTDEQKMDILKCRNDVKEQRRNLGEAVSALHSLEARICDNMLGARSVLGRIMGILRPDQQAKFLLWIEHNQACMHMLNSLWSLHDNKNIDVKPTLSID
jgi:hypothetical protein